MVGAREAGKLALTEHGSQSIDALRPFWAYLSAGEPEHRAEFLIECAKLPLAEVGLV